MKNRFKKTMTMAFVALLATGCNGSEITKEQAKERMAGITKYQEEHTKDLYENGFYAKAVIDGKSTDGREYMNISTEVWVANNYAHSKIKGTIKTSSVETKQSQEFYIGIIDNHYYRIDAVAKTYYDFGEVGQDSSSDAEDIFKQVQITYNSILSETNIEVILEKFPEGEAEFAEGYSGKIQSKGEGHLHFELNYKSEDGKTISNEELTFNNYRLASGKSKNITEKATINISASFSYSINAKMPSLNGFEKVDTLSD